jgi:hypothetical protein
MQVAKRRSLQLQQLGKVVDSRVAREVTREHQLQPQRLQQDTTAARLHYVKQRGVRDRSVIGQPAAEVAKVFSRQSRKRRNQDGGRAPELEDNGSPA